MQSDTIGIIGLGLVGSALAERLLAAGYRVLGYDIRDQAVEDLSRRGGAGAQSDGAVASACTRVILSLPTSAIGAQVVAEIAPLLAPGSLVIDTTTGEPGEIAGFGADLAARGIDYLDATVGGSSRQVREGHAIAICGGSAAAYARCSDLFEACFRQWFHVGPCGAGARMKLVTNLVLGLNRAALAEGLSFARACGVDPAQALEILQAGPAYSRAMDVKGRKMIEGDFTPEARLSQHLKDVRLILAWGERHGARLPLSALHRQLLEGLEQAGLGGFDNSIIIRAFDQARSDPSIGLEAGERPG